MKNPIKMPKSRPSDKAVQRALDEFKALVDKDVGDWYAMLMALTAAAEEDAKYRKKFEPSKDNDVELAVTLFGFSVISFLIGVMVKWHM